MKGSAIRSLILKDWRLHRIHIILSTVGGAAALAVLLVGGETATVLGSVWFFIALTQRTYRAATICFACR